MKKEIVTFEIDGREVHLESGRLAKQADGSFLSQVEIILF